MSITHLGGGRTPVASVRGDPMTRRVFTIRIADGRWGVFDGDDRLADCGDFDLASAAAARLARAAFDQGVAVKVVAER